jgi:hypothetical protein
MPPQATAWALRAGFLAVSGPFQVHPAIARDDIDEGVLHRSLRDSEDLVLSAGEINAASGGQY